MSSTSLNLPPMRLLACTLVCLTALAACGKSGGDKTPATQVAVKVNDDEISVHQVNQALSRARLTPEQAGAAGKQVLEQLIDQQLLIQKSLEKKLDRDPDVLNALEASRRQILSQAYLEKSVAAALPKPAPEDVKKFYDAHPDLFANRRIYRLQELSAVVTPEQLAALREQTDKTKNMNDVAAWLRNAGIRFSANAAVRGAEQLPLESLPRIAQMKDGEITVTQAAGGITVLQMAGAQPMPMNEKEAGPFIEQYLANQKRMELASAEMKQLRQAAKLEYKGDFVKTAAGSPATPAAVPAGATAATGATTAAPAAGTAAGSPAPAAASAKPADNGSAAALDKGISGLK